MEGVETPPGGRHWVQVQAVSPDGQYLAIGNTAPGATSYAMGLGNQGEVLQVKVQRLLPADSFRTHR